MAMVVVGVSHHHWRGYWSHCRCRGGINHSVASSEGLRRSWGQETCNPGLLGPPDVLKIPKTMLEVN